MFPGAACDLPSRGKEASPCCETGSLLAEESKKGKHRNRRIRRGCFPFDFHRQDQMKITGDSEQSLPGPARTLP